MRLGPFPTTAALIAIVSIGSIVLLAGCNPGAEGQTTASPDPGQQSSSGVRQASVKVQTDADGHTIEQKNVAKRLTEDNTPGAIKYLYIQSPYTGHIIQYSSVQGKVTSSGKRLNPSSVAAGGIGISGYEQSGSSEYYGLPGPNGEKTTEVQNDDGTYGPSNPYIYWWDQRGNYHQAFVQSVLVTVNSTPLPVPDDAINLDTSKK